MSQTKKAKWPKVGTLRRNDNGHYIKLEANVDIYIDGKKFELNKSRTIKMDDPRATVNRLFDLGVISEADKDKRLEKLAENSWLKYELTAVPPKST